ncbi:MAG TPA: hypothetical protein VNK96_06300 [Fimbriimonadales bacterium]|nr:hypothetical protein [Fimbriimonadales bacterium]
MPRVSEEIAITAEDLAGVSSFDDLARLFHEKLNWPRPDWPTFKDVAHLYGIPQSDIPGVTALAAVQKLDEWQQWGIFLVDFGDNQLRRSDLRKILHKVAEEARKEHANPVWPHDNILFICKHRDGWTLGYFRGENLANAKLHCFGWSDPHRARTALTRNLPELRWDNQENWERAWDAERLTKEFFSDYRKVFEQVEKMVVGLETDNARRFTQSLFNRLMFLCFLQEKGWLEFNKERKDYLFKLHEEFVPYNEKNYHEKRFYDRLRLLFFSGLNSKNHAGGARKYLEKLIGKIPFLNGGLFEADPVLDRADVYVPDEAFPIIFDLFKRYTFTVTESTPLDVEVALDPEMLGKIFEELVIGRHEVGSYYTPRPIVSFMCKEALKGYLQDACPSDLSPDEWNKQIYETR